jgi:hypothetical protein
MWAPRYEKKTIKNSNKPTTTTTTTKKEPEEKNIKKLKKHKS